MKSSNIHRLRSANWLMDCSIATADGEKGKLADQFFDEDEWQWQYLLVTTGAWLHGREAFVSINAVHAVHDKEQLLELSTSSKGVHDSPDLDTALPISQEAALLLAKYWQWATPAAGDLPPEIANSIEAEASEEGKEKIERATRSRLRSVKEIEGYTISAPDGDLGKLADLLYDRDWKVRYVVVDTPNGPPDKRVLLPVPHIEEIRWADHSVQARHSRDLIREE